MDRKALINVVIIAFGVLSFIYLPPLLQSVLDNADGVTKLVVFLAHFLSAWVVVFVIKSWLNSIIKRKKMKKELKFYLTSTLQLFYFASLLVIAMVSLGTPFSDFMTFLGILSAGLAVALQKPILNFAGFIIIIFSKLYAKGDFIKIKDIVGVVEEVDVMHTYLIEYTEDGVIKGSYTSIPNSFVLTNPLVNFNKPFIPVTASFTVSLTYESNVNKALKKLKDIISKEWDAYLEQCDDEWCKYLRDKRFFVVSDFASSSIDLTVIFFVPFSHLAFLKTALVNAVFNELPEDDIEIAYPHVKLMFKEGVNTIRVKGEHDQAS